MSVDDFERLMEPLNNTVPQDPQTKALKEELNTALKPFDWMIDSSEDA